MKDLKISILLLSSAVSLVLGHGYVTYSVIDGKLWGGYNPYTDPLTKPPPNRIGYSLSDNDPVYDPLSPDIACNFQPLPGPPKLVAPARAGTNMTMTWTTWPNSHIGPTMTYLAYCPNGCRDPSVNITTLSFFKIHQDGLRDDATWFTDRFLKNNSTVTVPIPKDMKNGEYLVRHELLSLHAALDPKYGPEYYPSCFQISITNGTGTSVPPGVTFPGAYKRDDPGVTYDVYSKPPKTYIFPGPPLYNKL